MGDADAVRGLPAGLPVRWRPRLMAWGAAAALVACLLNGVWLACMVFLQGVGDVAAQAGGHPAVFRVSVGAALLLTLAQVPLLASTAVVAAHRDPVRALVGGAWYLLYVPVNLVAYFAYGRLGPIVHAPDAASDPNSALVAALVEIGHPLGLTGSLPLLGYGMLGLAWCLLASALRGRSRLWTTAAALLFLSGLLSILGALGAFADLAWMTAGCFLGGVVSLPALAVLGLALRREVRHG